jgi:hypothetical protein
MAPQESLEHREKLKEKMCCCEQGINEHVRHAPSGSAFGVWSQSFLKTAWPKDGGRTFWVRSIEDSH